MEENADSLKTILIVDDDEAVAKVMKSHLEPEGYAVLVEGTGRAAMETVQSADKLYAVLLDLGLPDMDGMEVLSAIKKKNPHLNVIVVTGSHDESKGRQAYELGAWDYVTKPIDFKYLKNILLLIMPS